MREMPWVEDVKVRLREEGHVYFGEIVVVPSTRQNLIENIEAAQDHLESLDWKLHELVIMPVSDLREDELIEEASSPPAPA